MLKPRLLVYVILFCTVVSVSTLLIHRLPSALKSQILSLIEQQTNGTATLNEAHVGILPLSFQLAQFSLQQKDNPVLQFDSLTVKFNLWQSLQQRTLVIDQFSLVKPRIHLAKQQNGQLNVTQLFKKTSDNESSRLFFPITLKQLSLSDGELFWHEGISTQTIQAIQLTASNISTDSDKKSPVTLSFNLPAGGAVDVQAETCLIPFQSSAHLKLTGIQLQLLQEILLPAADFNISGLAQFDSDYHISYTKQQFKLTAQKAKLVLHDFQYNEKTNDALHITATDFSHETDLDMHYANHVWQISANKAKITLQGFRFSQNTAANTLLQVPNLNYEADIKAVSTAQNHWQLASKHSQLISQNIALDYANASFKAASFAIETQIDSLFGDKIHVTTQQGKITSQNLQLLARNQPNPLSDMPKLAISGIAFNFAQQTLNIAAVQAEQAVFRSEINASGISDYPDLLPIGAQTIEQTDITASPTTAWTVNIGQIKLSDFATHFVDARQKQPIALEINPININLTDYSNKIGASLPFQLDASINKSGSLRLKGEAIMQPFSAQLTVNAKDLALEPFQAYLEKVARLDIRDGLFASHSTISITTQENAPLDLKITGDASISNFISRDQFEHKDFITWKKLELKDFAVDLQKNHYTAAALAINQPYARAIIKEDKTSNFSDIFISEPTTPSKVGKKSTEPDSYFKLGKIDIIDGTSDFTDNSLILPFAAQIKSLDGGASDLSSDKKTMIKATLQGNAYDLAPVDVAGQLNPYSGDYDLTLNFNGMPMPLISPYMVQFAGYKVEKGKMTLNLKYKVSSGELFASNNILIDQFQLGEKVENPNAVSLPLELAVALLKDSDGKIRIDVPITGNFNNPQFDMGSIISEALVNALEKVISSPFNAIASLIGSDEEELSQVLFKEGSATLDKAQQEKLTALAGLLKQRSALTLGIKGTAFVAQDWAALREAALYDVLKRMRAEEINKQNNKKILAEYVNLSEEDYKRLLAQLFLAKFPQLAKKSLFGTPELINDKGDFYGVAKQKLSESLEQEQHRLKELATQRARAIASFLVQKNNVPSQQIFILDSIVDPKRDDKDIASILSVQVN